MQHQNPIPTVDIIIEIPEGIVLIKRKNPPFGWALPGGFIEYNESAEDAAKREAYEETGLMCEDLKQFHTYSAPDRDPRHHTISIVFTAKAKGTPCADSDAANIGIFTRENLPQPLAFDHHQILEDYFNKRY